MELDSSVLLFLPYFKLYYFITKQDIISILFLKDFFTIFPNLN